MCGCSSVGSKASITPQTLNNSAKAPQANAQQGSNIPPEIAALLQALTQGGGAAAGGGGLNVTA